MSKLAREITSEICDALTINEMAHCGQIHVDAPAAIQRIVEHRLADAGHVDLLTLCEAVIADATGSLDDPDKRVWPIRAGLYRELKAAIAKAKGTP